jgi:nucleoside-diphosphate-sugar epimerase
MNALVIGGTRNLGPSIVTNLVEMGYRTSVFHRGVTKAEFGPEVERLYGDRSSEEQLRSAVAGRNFDVVVDTTIYNPEEAAITARVLAARVGRYIALSTGQVYLVRSGIERPYHEEDYEGPVVPQPGESDLANWRYGVEKRAAEDELRRTGFPAIWLRMPIVNSERDHYGRVAGYLARLRDGGPILIPEGPHLALRHLYGEDVVQAICHAAAGHVPVGTAWNLSQDEELSLEQFLTLLAESAGLPLRLAPVPRHVLEERGLLPDCSPFSGRWMSALDNRRWKQTFNWQFTAPQVYLPRLVAAQPAVPAGYAQRSRELALLPSTTALDSISGPLT